MTAIRLRFPAARYHANPWGRHVNEGVAEWPPSPYRLLRALYDTWQRKCPHLEKAAVEQALGALAGGDPRFHLPGAAASHTRAYLSANKEDPTGKSLIFDAFVAFDRGAECFIEWPELELGAAPRAVLAELLGKLNYLGRSESWIEAGFCGSPPAGLYVCAPAAAAECDGEIVPVACVVAPAEYHGKRAWLDALTDSTTDMLKARRSAPLLLRTVRYVVPARAVETDPPGRPARRAPKVHAVLLALDSAVLPLVTSTVEIAEQIRVRLMGAHAKRLGRDRVSPLFSGKAGGAMRLDHGHLFILPLANRENRIHRVLLLSRKRPWTADELDAVRGVRELWQADNRPGIACVTAWQGPIEDAVRPAATVVSTTPFVTVRHTRKGRDRFLEDEVARECRNHGLPAPAAVECLKRPAGSLFECVEFRRNRKDDPPRPGYAFRLRFNEPVPAPFSLGYGCHFGLGQFHSEVPDAQFLPGLL